MNLTKIFGNRMTVADGLRLPVSRHFYYSAFAVRGRYATGSHMGGQYVCEGAPGTGFFIRNTESHSYARFVSACRKKNDQSFFTLLFGREPSFDKEYKRVDAAFSRIDDEKSRSILSAYQNVLGLAKEEELLQRIVRAVKDKMGHKPNKRLTSVLTHYKSSIASLERDARSAQLNYSNLLGEEQAAEWIKVVETFHLLVNARRVWAVFNDNGNPAYQQVFFDMGIFDYIQQPGDTPVMRDQREVHYYLYPDDIVAARSSVDFDFVEWKDVEVQFNVVDISTLGVRPQFNSHKRRKKHHGNHTDALSTLYGTTRQQVVGELYFPKFDIRFYVNHTGPAEDFAKAISDYKTKC